MSNTKNRVGERDLVLVLREVPASRLSDLAYGHVMLDVMRVPDRHNAKLESLGYGNVLDKLAISTQIDSDAKRGRLSYGGGVGFALSGSFEHPTTLDEMDGRVKFLRALENKVAKLEAKYGRPESFGQLVARYADALGITDIMVRRPKSGEWVFGGNIVSEVNYAVETVARGCRKLAGRSEDLDEDPRQPAEQLCGRCGERPVQNNGMNSCDTCAVS